VHNSYYFHKYDNRIDRKEEVIKCFEQLIDELLRTWRVKNWYRAYFNCGLINYIEDGRRLLPCPAGSETFFLDPFGEVRPCNGMEESLWFASMGNLRERSFEEVWHSDKAQRVREMVANCPKNCWMIGTAGPAMKSHLWKTSSWVIRNKLSNMLRRAR